MPRTPLMERGVLDGMEVFDGTGVLVGVRVGVEVGVSVGMAEGNAVGVMMASAR